MTTKPERSEGGFVSKVSPTKPERRKTGSGPKDREGGFARVMSGGFRTFAGSLAVFCVLVVAPSPAQADWTDYMIEMWRSFFGSTPPAPARPRPQAPVEDPFPNLPSIGLAAKQITVTEGEALVRAVIKRSRSDLRSTVTVTTKAGQATPGADFKAVERVIVFEPGDVQKTIEIEIIDNETHEPAENFQLILSDPKLSTLIEGGAQARITIRDNDEKPVPPARPRLGFKPITVTFGKALMGETVYRDIILRNRLSPSAKEGEADVAWVKIEGDRSGAFRMSHDGCTGEALPPGASCTLTIAFNPSAAGAYAARVSAEARAVGGVWSGRSNISGIAERPVVQEDPLAARIAALKAQRRADSGRLDVAREVPDEDLPQAAYRIKDEDYGFIGVGRNYFTLPVDRTRIITVDRFIPCVLEDTINSQQPGFAVCVVERHVYGSDQRFVLIPAGTRVVGQYQQLAKTGDTRLSIVWTRFIRPDGASIAVGDGFQTTDQAGRTGLPGHVDNRFLERFGGALLVTGLTVGAALAIPSDDESFSAAFESIAENAGQIGTQMLEENLDLTPIMTIAAGTRMVIRPLVDLWLANADRLVPADQSTGQPPVGAAGAAGGPAG